MNSHFRYHDRFCGFHVINFDFGLHRAIIILPTLPVVTRSDSILLHKIPPFRQKKGREEWVRI
jgi:hypothetical protein